MFKLSKLILILIFSSSSLFAVSYGISKGKNLYFFTTPSLNSKSNQKIDKYDTFEIKSCDKFGWCKIVDKELYIQKHLISIIKKRKIIEEKNIPLLVEKVKNTKKYSIKKDNQSLKYQEALKVF